MLDPQWFCRLAIIGVGYTVYPGLNLVYMWIYKLNHPFFEQFKDNDLPWPWVTEPVKFRKQVIKAIKLIAFNNLVVGAAFAWVIFFPVGLTFKYSMADLPSL